MAPKTADSLASLGRCSEPALHIPIALADGPKHGYAMAQNIEAMTGSRPGPGTLYGASARLEERKWIESLPADDRRRPYNLLGQGLSRDDRHRYSLADAGGRGTGGAMDAHT